MTAAEQVKVTFQKTAGLSAFCQGLRGYRISYILAGDNTVILEGAAFQYVVNRKLGALKDHEHRVEPAVPLRGLSPEAQNVVTGNRLMPKPKLLENIRARLARFH